MGWKKTNLPAHALLFLFAEELLKKEVCSFGHVWSLHYLCTSFQ